MRPVTHIAPPAEDGTLIEEKITDEGVICVPAKKLGICASVTGARFAVTTEVYPDSEKATDQQCNDAQVASITGAIDFYKSTPYFF